MLPVIMTNFRFTVNLLSMKKISVRPSTSCGNRVVKLKKEPRYDILGI